MKLKKVTLYNKVHEVNNTILYTSNVEKVAFMLMIFLPHYAIWRRRGGKKNLRHGDSSKEHSLHLTELKDTDQ